jgi:hypothetical protein
MKVILREVVLLASSIVVMAGFQNSVQKPLAIPPKALPGPYQPLTPIPNVAIQVQPSGPLGVPLSQ